MKGLSKWKPLPKNIFTLGQNVSFLLVDQSPTSICQWHSKKVCYIENPKERSKQKIGQ